MLVDTHCHLDAAEFEADRDDVARAADATGVRTIVVPSVDAESFPKVASVCARYPGCQPAYGIHPLFVDRATPQDLETLREYLKKGSPVAVGEIGLDFFVEPRDEVRQIHYFVEQLKLAREFDLPVILHVRRAIDAVLKELRRTRVRGGIAHAFNGSRQQAEAFIALGFKLGIGGAMTYDRALKLRELARTLPIEAIVLETDAPDIPPAWLNRGRNNPAQLRRIAEELAALRNITLDEVAMQTTHNAAEALAGISGACQG